MHVYNSLAVENSPDIDEWMSVNDVLKMLEDLYFSGNQKNAIYAINKKILEQMKD